MVVPAVIHEIHAVIDGGANEADAFLVVGRLSDMIPAETKHRYLLSCASQRPVQHVTFSDGPLLRG